MRQILLLTALIFAINLSAQNISGTDISKDSSIQYIEISVNYYIKFFKVKMDVYVNYGQEGGNRDNGIIMDAGGKPRIFVSRPELLNYLYEAGWKIITTYPVETSNGFASYYLMERRK